MTRSIVGERFGYLEVISESRKVVVFKSTKGKRIYYRCRGWSITEAFTTKININMWRQKK